MAGHPKDADGRAKLYADIAHPINSDCREMIQESVIREFFDEIERAKQPGYVSRYDDFDFEYADAPRPRPARVDQAHAAAGPMSRKFPSNTNAAAPQRTQATTISHRQAQKHRRHDATIARRRASAEFLPELSKGDNFGAGIFPELAI